ncbi:MAG: hypothetical protein IJB32_04375, partial [Clostridia bacterium]|nr:hypothetical protein [Clostridia bacterium]
MKIKNFIIRVISILFIFLFTLTSFITLPYSTVKAEETNVQYTDVMEDLEKADNFNPEVYPLDENNYSLEFIGLSESSKKELFVYVYVPSGNEHNIQATSINISQVHKDVDFSNYFLSLVSKDGVFHKYKVEGLVVKTEPVRYYEISSIFRKFDELLDGSPFSAQNTISEVVYAVGKSYRLVDVSGDNYDVYVEDIDLITITDRYVGFMRYPDGGWFNIADGVDVHFIAFSTDLRIDSLLEADLVYTSRTFEKSSTTFTNISYGEPKKEKVTVNYKDNMTYDGSG